MSPAIGTDPFIGREREMAELTAALGGALEGRGGLVVLAGQPGIGKTRLTEELAAVSLDRGARVIMSACYEGRGHTAVLAVDPGDSVTADGTY